jgi:hypothetical protein
MREEKLLTHLVKRKLNTTNEKNIIICRTGGLPIFLQKITRHRKQTCNVSSPTKRSRCRLLQNVRQHIAGSSTESIETQHAYELKRLQKTSRSNICEKAGLKGSIPTPLSLAMKESLQLTWRQERKHRLYLKKSRNSLST